MKNEGEIQSSYRFQINLPLQQTTIIPRSILRWRKQIKILKQTLKTSMKQSGQNYNYNIQEGKGPRRRVNDNKQKLNLDSKVSPKVVIQQMGSIINEQMLYLGFDPLYLLKCQYPPQNGAQIHARKPQGGHLNEWALKQWNTPRKGTLQW